MSTYSVLCVLFIIAFIWLNISKKPAHEELSNQIRKKQMKEKPHLYKK